MVVDAADTDFAALESEVYLQQAAALADALGLTAPSDRGTGPREIRAHAGGFLVLWRDAGPALQLLQTDAAGRLRWSAPLRFASGASLARAEWKQVDGVDEPVLRVGLDGLPASAASELLFAVAADGPMLIRATTGNGRLANARVDDDHPDLPTVPGAIASDDRVDRLASTVYLAGAERREERSKPGVRSHLQQLAGGTDLWLAQAAAELLTLPAD